MTDKENTSAQRKTGQDEQNQQNEPAEQLPSWNELGLSEEALQLIEKAGFTKPTAVQAKAIQPAVAGRDIIASAQTGSGKTAGFVIPMIEKFAGKEGTYGLILAPTRELAQQIQATIDLFGAPRKIRSAVLIGGVNMRLDAQALDTYPHIIVATPGRLCDHLDRGNLWLDFIQIVVLDEADRMLDMGFATQLSRIMEEVPQSRQTLLFSATIPPNVQKLANRILKDPVQITIGKPLGAAKTVEQRFLWVGEDEKNRQLLRLLKEEKGSVIIFTKSKDKATRVWRSLHSAGVYDATYLHSDRLQSHREQALAEFKGGKYRILVATDVAGRGIHVDEVAHVINYDLPMEPEDYVHRIGRTGRAGSSGKATTFITPGDRRLLGQIERILKTTIEPEGDATSDRPPRGRGGGGRAAGGETRGGRDSEKSRSRRGGNPSPQKTSTSKSGSSESQPGRVLAPKKSSD